MVDALDIFRETNVRLNFVSCVEMAKPYGFATVKETVKSTTEGFDFMMRHGIFPRPNQWRREPRPLLVSHHLQPAIPLEFYLELMGN
jgi:hypothetical protein